MSSDLKLSICLINIHGLFRSHDLELGRDSDTGGQTKYVLELATALSKNPQVAEVIVLTRQIFDAKVSEEYALPEEEIAPNAKIVRIPCGPKRYLRKESLWPYLDTFIDRSLNYFRRMGKIPHVFHGHYADAGYVASQLARLLQVPALFTGHSLGRVKRERLTKKGKDHDRIESQYQLSMRIEAEEISLDTASVVITSTVQEVEEQYAVYEQYQPGNMEVIPPGVDLMSFSPPEGEICSPVIDEIKGFLREPDKPVILAIARPDERKNIATLIETYGSSKELQRAANLVVVAGTRDDIRLLPPSQKREFIKYLTLIDAYSLYGKIAYPKSHSSDEVKLIYKWAVTTGGVFINPALTEPFGLTLLEAAASGLPIIATNDGGPRDIIAQCKNGLLIDPLNSSDIESSLLRVLTDRDLWKEYSENGIERSKRFYSWETHCDKYLRDIYDLLKEETPSRYTIPKPARALPDMDRIIITDIDNTLTGDDDALKEFVDLINGMPDNIGFGIATGRNRDDALSLLESIGVPRPNLLITSVGTEIYYGEDLVEDRSWHKQLDDQWEPEKIHAVLDDIPGLYLQDESCQARFKISYRLDADVAPSASEIRKLVRNNRIKAKVILSLGTYLDIIPLRAGEGLAVRQLSFRWGLPWENILIAGDCGNDEALLKGETLGVVVANFSPELEKLRSYPRIFFSEKSNARGIIDGIEYYNFLSDIRVPNDSLDK